MEDRNEAIADALEALHMNQQAIRARVEEIALWLRARDSALQTLDTNADAIASSKERLRTLPRHDGFLRLRYFGEIAGNNELPRERLLGSTANLPALADPPIPLLDSSHLEHVRCCHLGKRPLKIHRHHSP